MNHREPGYLWHCLNSIDWQMVALVWPSSGVAHNTVPDTIMTLAALAVGIPYEGQRFNQWTSTYGWTKTATGFPPPLDWVWLTPNALWYIVGDSFVTEGDADWDKCLIFKGPWFQGAGWPERWP